MRAKVTAAVTIALALAGAWAGLRAGECRDVAVVCDESETDAGVVRSAHHETVTVRFGSEPDPKTLDLATPTPCRVTKLGPAYACSPLGAAVARYDDAHQPASGCACSDGSPGCERLDASGKWVAAPRAPEILQPGRWRGTCPGVPACEEAEEMRTGAGAQNAIGYLSLPACGGAGRKPPAGQVVTAKALE